jgi:hypothetical protein
VAKIQIIGTACFLWRIVVWPSVNGDFKLALGG